MSHLTRALDMNRTLKNCDPHKLTPGQENMLALGKSLDEAESERDDFYNGLVEALSGKPLSVDFEDGEDVLATAKEAIDRFGAAEEKLAMLVDALKNRCPCWGGETGNTDGHSRDDCHQKKALKATAADVRAWRECIKRKTLEPILTAGRQLASWAAGVNPDGVKDTDDWKHGLWERVAFWERAVETAGETDD